tara:strand:- start:6183 stop:6932 length:750 start_codon:yes stop_codon:yes gene_type:complete
MYLTERIFIEHKNIFSQIISNNINKRREEQLNFIDSEIVISFIIIFLSDKILCMFFGKKGRYYQLHSFINAIITYRILPDIKKFYINPINAYRLLNTNLDSYLIVSLHIYHMIISRTLNFIEIIHHLLFVALGVVPVIFYINSNQIYLGYIACAGIPGIFEYGILTLFKNNLISSYNQKYYTVYLYNYFRYPLALYGCFFNLTMWRYNKILNNDNLYLSIYINILLFINGSVFNQLTFKSFYFKPNNFD